MLSITHEAWLTGGGRECREGGGDERCGGDGDPEACTFGTVDSFDCLVVRGGFAPGFLAVMGPEEDVGMLLNACVVEMESSQAADVVYDVIE